MPKFLPIKASFSAGEISPLMAHRVDLEAYPHAVRTMVNMRADPHGPAVQRDGTVLIDSFDATYGQLYTFQASPALFFDFVILGDTTYVMTPTGRMPALNYVSNPLFTLGAVDWTPFAQGVGSEVSFTENRCRMKVAPGGQVYIEQNITVDANVELKIDVGRFVSKMPEGATLRLMIGTTQGGVDLLDQLITTFRTVGTIPAQPATDLWIRLELMSTQAMAEVFVGKVLVSDLTSGDLSLPSPWLASEVGQLHFIPAPGGREVYAVHPNVEPYKFIYDPQTETFTLQQVSFTNQPVQWGPDNWPATGTIYQGRLWLGGTYNEQETFWGSVSGSFENFNLGPQDSDGVEFTIAQSGRIRWMSGYKALVIGTVNGEHIVNSDGSVITASNVELAQQSSYGSNDLQALQVGDQIFYVSPDGLKVRAMAYKWEDNNWLSRDVTFVSEHITESGVVDVTWAQNPYNQYWALLRNGKLAGLSYERGNNIFGWNEVYSQDPMATVSNGELVGTSIITGLFKRVDGKLYYEVMLPLDNALDAMLERDVLGDDTAGYYIDSLDALEGREVSILVDGAVHPSRVVSSGRVDLQWGGTTARVGLLVEVKLVTLPLVSMSQQGSTAPMPKRWNEVYVGLVDSVVPVINGVRPEDRYPATPMDTAEPMWTGHVRANTLQDGLDASVEIMNDMPFHLRVAGLFGEAEQAML